MNLDLQINHCRKWTSNGWDGENDPNKFILYKRDWCFQGDRPDYTDIGTIDLKAAKALVKAGVASDHTTGQILTPKKKNAKLSKR